jgi:hypothetical protein
MPRRQKMPKAELTWKKVAGSHLVDALDEGFIGDVPEESGIYIWKLAVGPGRPFSTADDLAEHVRSRIRTPVGSAKGQLGMFYQFKDLTIAGTELPSEKRHRLISRADEAVHGITFRRFMKSFLDSLDAFTPALYVGEATDLRKRVRDHLNYQTGFSTFVDEQPMLEFGKLDFYFYATPFLGQDDRIRKTLEYIATMTSLSGFGSRPG